MATSAGTLDIRVIPRIVTMRRRVDFRFIRHFTHAPLGTRAGGRRESQDGAV
jgi:hypothetical protein